MLAKYKRRSNIAAAVGFVAMLVLVFLTPLKPGGNVWKDGNIILQSVSITTGVAWFYALWAYAKAKGRSGLWLLACIVPVGLIVLLFLKDKHKGGEEKIISPAASPPTERASKIGELMNRHQRRILFAAAAIIVAMLIYPPFREHGRGGVIENCGYGFLLSQPQYCSHATVDTSLLLVQFIAVVLVAGILCLALRDKP